MSTMSELVSVFYIKFILNKPQIKDIVDADTQSLYVNTRASLFIAWIAACVSHKMHVYIVDLNINYVLLGCTKYPIIALQLSYWCTVSEYLDIQRASTSHWPTSNFSSQTWPRNIIRWQLNSGKRLKHWRLFSLTLLNHQSKNFCCIKCYCNFYLDMILVGFFADKLRKYFTGHLVALNQEFGLLWTHSGHIAAL